MQACQTHGAGNSLCRPRAALAMESRRGTRPHANTSAALLPSGPSIGSPVAPTFRPGATSLRSHANGVASVAAEEALREEPAEAATATEGVTAAAAAAVATAPSLRTVVSARVADRDILARTIAA